MDKSVEAVGTSGRIRVVVRYSEITHDVDIDILENMWNTLVGRDVYGMALMYSTVINSSERNAPVFHKIVSDGIVDILEKMRDRMDEIGCNSKNVNTTNNGTFMTGITSVRYGRILCPHMGSCDIHEFRCCLVCSGYLDNVDDVDRCPFRNGKFSEIVNLKFLHLMTPAEKIFDFGNRIDD